MNLPFSDHGRAYTSLSQPNHYQSGIHAGFFIFGSEAFHLHGRAIASRCYLKCQGCIFWNPRICHLMRCQEFPDTKLQSNRSRSFSVPHETNKKPRHLCDSSSGIKLLHKSFVTPACNRILDSSLHIVQVSRGGHCSTRGS